jgi:hypothetical protein
VRILVASTADVLPLEPASGWSSAIHRECDWRVRRVDTAKGLERALANLPRLRGLDLSVSHPPALARQAFERLFDRSALARLHRLDISVLHFGPDTDAFARGGRTAPRALRSLRLYLNGLGPSLPAAVSELARPGRLQRLDVGANDAELTNVHFLASGGFLDDLTDLQLGPNPMSGLDIVELFRARPPLRLRSLGLTGIHGIEHALPVLLDPSLLPALRRLGLGATGLGERGLRHLVASPIFLRLESLDLTGNSFREEDLEVLLAVRRPPALRDFQVDAEEMPDQLQRRLRLWIAGD